jgi:hypothetical protein
MYLESLNVFVAEDQLKRIQACATPNMRQSALDTIVRDLRSVLEKTTPKSIEESWFKLRQNAVVRKKGIK